MFLFGAAMVLIMVLKPTGVMGRREPTIRLHKKKDAAEDAEAQPEIAQ